MKKEALDWWNSKGFAEQAKLWKKWKNITLSSQKELPLIEFERSTDNIEILFKQLNHLDDLKKSAKDKKKVILVGGHGMALSSAAHGIIKELRDSGIDVELTEEPPAKEEVKDFTLSKFTKNIYPLELYNNAYVEHGDDTPLPRDLQNARKIEVRTEPKIGRNDKCTCGSGKKYKSCCLK